MNARTILLILTLSLLSATFTAAGYNKSITIDGIEYEYNDYSASVKKVRSLEACSGKKITIPSQIRVGFQDITVSGIKKGAFKGCFAQTIKLPNTIKRIEQSAFENCKNLIKITIPSGVKRIEDRTFSNCQNLKEVIMPEVEHIGKWAFSSCPSLSKLELPKKLTKIGACAFSACYSLKKVIIPDGVKEVEGQAFSGCWQIESIHIPESVTDIGFNAFAGCSKLTNVALPGSLRKLGAGAFPDDITTELIIPQSITEIGNIQDYYTFSTKYVFDCKAHLMTDVIHVDYIKSKEVIAKSDFSVGNFDFKINDDSQSVTLVSSYLRQYNHANIDIPNSVTYQGHNYFVTDIARAAFIACQKLEKITLPDSLRTIGELAFADCNSLAIIDIPDAVDLIGSYAFLRCSSIENIAIPERVSKLNTATFYSCKKLKHVVLTNVECIGREAFRGCAALATVDGFSIRTIEENGFDNCKSLSTIDLRKTEQIGSGGLRGANLPIAELTSIKELGAWALCNNFKLKYVILSDSLDCIPCHAFSGCTNLKYINIENIKEFGDNAFDGCYALWDYSIPVGAKVGSDAFKDCGMYMKAKIAENARQKQIQEQQSQQQIIEQQAEIERRNRQNAWLQMADALGRMANSLNQVINRNSSRNYAATTTPAARTSTSTTPATSETKSSGTQTKRKTSPNMMSLIHTYNNWISRLIKMNAQYDKAYNNSDRIRYQKEARSVREFAEQFDNCAVHKSSWEDWDGRRKR